MTWLKGSTTWQNCVSDLTKLACGEIADGSSVTCSSGDRWVRTVAGQDHIRSHASKDVALGDMAQRQGYMTLISYRGTATEAYTPIQSICRITNIYTSNPSTTAGRWTLRVTVGTANTVAGTYSNASLSYILHDADTGTAITSNSATPNAAGTATLSNGVQVSTTDPVTGILLAGTTWMRTFTTTYVGGIDWWGPLYCKRSLNALATPTTDATFTVSPPNGVAGTDWDANVDIPLGWDHASTNTYVNHRGGAAEGLGIKTNTGLSGGRYVFNYNVALQTMRMVAGSGATNGQILLEVQGGLKVDTVYQNPTSRQRGGAQVAVWLRPYQTAGSVTNGSAIQYWMSVKPDKIVIVLNADVAQTGKLTCAWLGTFTPNYTEDKFPVVWGSQIVNGSQRDYVTDHTLNTEFWAHTAYTVWNQHRRQDDSELRDWQTRWARADLQSQVAIIVSDSFSINAPSQAGSIGYIGQNLIPMGVASDYAASVNSVPMVIPPRQAKPNQLDSKWHLYQYYWGDKPPQVGTGGNAGVNETAQADRTVRGVTSTVFFIPGDGWTSGDELTDTVTSKVYFLVAADYHNVGARIRVTTNTYVGGAAIIEE